MESLGEKLINARNEKGFDLDQISRETNISLRFLEALEAEDFSIFPGEPYIIGFLRNYASFLELDVQKVLSLYRALRIQEQPVPVEQLIKKPPKIPAFLLPALAILLAVGAVGFGIYSLVVHIVENAERPAPAARVPVEHLLEGNSMERRLHINDAVLVPIGTERYRLELVNLSETITIRTPSGTEILDLGQEVGIDLNNDGTPDLRITVADFARNNPAMGASLIFSLAASAALEIPFAAVSAAASAAGVTTIIPSSPSAFPFTLQANFHGFCMFRWEILREPDRAGTNQRYFQPNESLEVMAQNLGMRIWASNATAARFQVIGGGRTFPVEIGSPGEVVVAEILWVRDDDGTFRVVLARLEH